MLYYYYYYYYEGQYFNVLVFITDLIFELDLSSNYICLFYLFVDKANDAAE